MQDQNELQTIGTEEVGTIDGSTLVGADVTATEITAGSIDVNAVEAQTAGNTYEVEGALHANVDGDNAEQDDEAEVEEQATEEIVGRDHLRPDEQWVTIREGNNKKWRAPAVEKNRKKMAKASKKRNRRK